MNDAEYELIGDKYETDPMCLNKRAGGNKSGFSEYSRQLCRDHHKGGTTGKHWTLSEESKKNIGEAKKNKKQSPEHIAKRMKSKIENGNSNHSDVTIQKISNSKKGKHRMYIDENHYIMVA